jgi:hypothetical protein
MATAIKTQRILLASAARTAAVASAKQVDAVEQYARVYVNVTAASGAGGLTCQFRGYDRVSGSAVALSTGGAAITATGLYVFEMMPNAQDAAGSVKETVGRMLPYQWDFQITVGDSSSYTYSVSAEVLPG